MAVDSLPAVVLLSGGLDSTTCLAIAQLEGFTPHTISFDYGQRHRYELDRAAEISKAANAASHRVVKIDLAAFGGSALVDAAIAVPKHDHADAIGTEIPVTYVPARNTVFLSLALALAETIGSSDLFIGVNALDYSGYPDCRPEYIAAFQSMANLATKSGVSGARPLKIHTPLIKWTKAQTIRRGLELGVDYSKTMSCYDPIPIADGSDATPCGHCDACLLRDRGFRELGLSPSP
ncbi:MAG: 7-cyano-7-deazaguanine synthase QueC [Planctomycetota bacterium]